MNRATRIALRGALAALLVLAGFADAAPAKHWTIVELTPDSAGGGLARDVNNRGEVVGHTLTQTGPLPFGFTATAFLWRNGVRQGIGSSAGRNSVAWAINERGTIVGTVDNTAYVWRDGQPASLHLAGNALALNNREEIVGTYWTGGALGAGQERPYLMRDGVLFELPTLNNAPGNSATGINDAGVAVGYSTIPGTSNEHAVMWQGLDIRDLGTLGGLESFGDRINNAGVIVGRAQDETGARFMTRWNASGGPPEKLQRGYMPSGINALGAIVGTDEITGAPFLYQDGNVMNLLEATGLKAAGWQTFTPMGINDRGWIVGTGWKPGVAFFGTALLLIPS